MQVSVVKGRLRGASLDAVLRRIFMKLADQHQESSEALVRKLSAAARSAEAPKKNRRSSERANTETLSVEGLVVVVNDCSRLADKCDDFAAWLVDEGVVVHGLDSEDAAQLDDSIVQHLSNLAGDFIAHALRVTIAIPGVFLNTDLHDAFEALFTRPWEESEGVGFVVILRTCQDYLADLRKWLSPHHFPKLLKEVVQHLVARSVLPMPSDHSGAVGRGNATEPRRRR